MHDIHNTIFANISTMQLPLFSLQLLDLFAINFTGAVHINMWLYVVLLHAIMFLRTISSSCTSS